MSKIKVGITHGDPNGVGYEVVFKAFADPQMFELCTPILYGSPKVAAYHRKAMELTTNYTTISAATEAHGEALYIIPCTADEVKVELGTGSEEAGKAAFDALERAVSDWKAGLIDVLVTAPINKHTIQNASFRFPGHTEYFQSKMDTPQEALMILMNDSMRVALVTAHLPIADVAKAITKEQIVSKLQQFNASLRRDFNISAPRIAVLSLNPHAGEEGFLGKEEQEIIQPAIQQASEQNILAYGPFAADGFFGSKAYDSYDGILAMYHDQGLAPFKLLAMEDGVNFTAGLSLVRTSPDHGTAYDIAGKGEANELSFRHAIYAAIDIFRNRRSWDEAHANPLQKLYVDKLEGRNKQE